MDDEVKRILYVQTTGVEQPERSATVFFLAASGAAMDIEVGIFFTQLGPSLLQRGVPETLRVRKGGVTLSHFMEQARDIGVKFYVCQPSLELTDLKMQDLIDGVEMIGGAAFNSMALDADRVVCF
ncbi:MAG: DsrE/DsrF/DrsH-like family protein [Candidatus Rokubacteria bacterium]|nr:DsrE/DsrF/DrsH-like family protein [Candidatus Rokubacteria bacterium]MBI4627821.1 DsrE/DsrF/DrsH-like family protein [Candidatus Rokubacteria bacterium]